MLASTLPAEQGSTWGESFDNRFRDTWIVETPLAEHWGKKELPPPAIKCEKEEHCAHPTDSAPGDVDMGLRACHDDSDCTTFSGSFCRELASSVKHEGDRPKKLCVGHSDALLDELYRAILEGKKTVDITSLSPPDGRFEAAVRNAITRLSERDNPPQVRMLFGVPLNANSSVPQLLASYTRDVKDASKLSLVVAIAAQSVTSWNHSKIVATDGNAALVGGSNMWTKDYLNSRPVHDVSVRVHGGAAADAQRFVNRLWKSVCADQKLLHRAKSVGPLVGDDGCLPAFESAPSTAQDGVPIIAVGRLGDIDKGAQAGDAALVAMIKASKTSVRIVQQDIGPPKVAGVKLAPWPTAILEAIGLAAMRGVAVEIVVSSPGKAGVYGNGWSIDDINRQIAAAAGISDVSKLCDKVRVTGFRSSKDGQWVDRDGEAVQFVHSKIIIVDSSAFYVGSQNIYTANLQEFGYIIDDAATTKSFESTYFDKLWSYSKAGVTCSK